MTKIIDALAKFNTDKNTNHSYGDVYEDLFSSYRESANHILEIGIHKGESLRALREYFINAHIYGIDTNPKSMIDHDERITTFQADQSNQIHVNLICKNRRFDIIIDDGSHVLAHQVLSAFYLMPYVKPGGLYIIEDIQEYSNLELFKTFKNVSLIDRRAIKGRYDDLLVVISKPSNTALGFHEEF